MRGWGQWIAWVGLMGMLTGCAALAEQGGVVRLRGNATTGYAWVLHSMEPAGVVACSEGAYQPDARGQGQDALVGVGGEYSFVLKALRPGETTLTFLQVRPWEPEAPAGRSVWRVRVEVDNSLRLERQDD